MVFSALGYLVSTVSLLSIGQILAAGQELHVAHKP